jgi:hypothetical protein
VARASDQEAALHLRADRAGRHRGLASVVTLPGRRPVRLRNGLEIVAAALEENREARRRALSRAAAPLGGMFVTPHN